MINKSIWYKDIQQYPTLKNNITCDILIVGGGLSGMSTAYYLSKKGHKVVVVDKGKIGGGTSGHTSAHVTIQHDLIYDYYFKRFGLNKTKRIAQANMEALEEIKKIVSEENIECDLKECSSTIITETKKNVKLIDKEYKICKSIGVNAFYSEKLDNVSFLKALTFDKQLHFNPVKYLNGLAKAVLDNGSEIYQDTHVLRLKGKCAYIDVLEINFKKIVIATHNPIINFPGTYFMKMYQERSYTIAFESFNKIDDLYNSIDDNGYTLRSYENFTLMGGNDHATGKKINTNHQKLLIDSANEIYGVNNVNNSWHAQDGITIDRLPYIGKYSKKNSDMFVITGFGKWGMTNSNIAGRIISDLVVNKENKYANIYSPQRKKNLRSIIMLIYINLLVFKDYTVGLLRIKSPRCSHLKCKTKYNKYTRSYDCPCHGSRFDESGNCIDSPAIHKIKPKN